jgi:DNA-binding transcriptional regulator YiaG
VPSSDTNPAPAAILAAREACDLTQEAASALVHSGLRTWQQWEAGDRRMHPGLWELFQIKSKKRISTRKSE